MTDPDPERHQRLWLALAALLGVFAGTFVLLAGFFVTSKHFDFWVSWEMIVAYILGAGAVVSFGAAMREAGFPLARRTIRHPAGPARDLFAPVALVNDIDPTGIGVDAAAPTVLGPDPVAGYVPRTSDAELRAAVQAALDGEGQWIVIARGPSKTGKSRSLFEALCRCAEQVPLELIAPVDLDALQSEITLAQMPDQRLRPNVLWLDDLEPFIDQGLTFQVLEKWRATASQGLVAATFGGKGSELVAGSASTKLATIAGQILQHTREISVRETTPEELAPLRPRLSAEAFASMERYGLAAYLVAAPLLERKLSTHRHAPGDPESPESEGIAVVYAAVDWVRCGRTDPISSKTLRALWPAYLPSGISATDANFDAGVAWARRPVAGRIALLHEGGSYRAYEYVVRRVIDDPAALAPLEQAWTAAIDDAVDGHALAVAAAALVNLRIDLALRALSSARKSSIDEVAAVASYNLGVTLDELRRYEEALAAYDDLLARFGDADEPALREPVANALVDKGAALERLGHYEEAIAAYDEVLAKLGDADEPDLRAAMRRALTERDRAARRDE